MQSSPTCFDTRAIDKSAQETDKRTQTSTLQLCFLLLHWKLSKRCLTYCCSRHGASAYTTSQYAWEAAFSKAQSRALIAALGRRKSWCPYCSARAVYGVAYVSAGMCMSSGLTHLCDQQYEGLWLMLSSSAPACFSHLLVCQLVCFQV